MTGKIIQFTQVENRLDAEFYRDEFDEVEQALDTADPNRIKSLIEVSDEIRKGIFDIRANQYVESGVPFVRISQIENLTIDISDAVYITEEENKRNSRTCLSPGDLVIAKSGVTMGITGYIPDNIDSCNISQDIVGVKTDFPEHRYLATYLSTPFGQLQMQRAGSQQAQQHLNLERARNLKIYLAPEQFRKEIDATVKEAHEKRAEADRLLSEAEDILENKLDLSLTHTRDNIYTTTHKNIGEQIRLDAEFYNPKYTDIIEGLHNCPYDMKQLNGSHNQFDLSNDKIDPSKKPDEEFRYLTISSVDENTGEITGHDLVKGHNAPNRARMRIKTGDVLVPYLSGSSQGVTVVPPEYNECVATTGYYVLRPEKSVPEYLFILMRSNLMQYQIEQMTSGAVMTSINKTDFKRLMLPILPEDDQKEIGKLARKSFKLRKESQELVSNSKERLERHIQKNTNK